MATIPPPKSKASTKPAGPTIQLNVAGTAKDLNITALCNDSAVANLALPLTVGTKIEGGTGNPWIETLPGITGKNPIQLKNGIGYGNNIDLTPYLKPGYNAVGIVVTVGTKTVTAWAPIPETATAGGPAATATPTAPKPGKLAKIIPGTPHMLTTPKTSPRQWRVSLRAVDGSGEGVGNAQLEWIFSKRHGFLVTSNTAGREGYRDVIINVNHDDVGPDKAPLNLEIRSMSYGEVAASVPLPPPPEPHTHKSILEQIRDGFFS